jgi:FKBP-type peptidyl-prolyl cis-trans isomerase
MNLSRITSFFVFTSILACTPPSEANAKKEAETKKADEGTKKEVKVSQNDLPAPSDVAAPPADAEKSASGLASKVITKGTGQVKPKPEDTVEVHYTGWTTDGKMFDSSRKRNRTAKFPLQNVIKGWTEGLQLMVEGEQRRFWIPADLAYGEVPKRPGAPAGQLTFDVELVKVIPAPKPLPVPETPKDVAAAPKDAQKSASGLAWKVLQKGTGTVKPTPADTVEVHYAGWTTDGKLFDNSYSRGETTSFPLGGVIKGWTEGLQHMVVGERTRFWIPASLAYGDTPRGGAPAGTLVFDVELISIKGK